MWNNTFSLKYQEAFGQKEDVSLVELFTAVLLRISTESLFLKSVTSIFVIFHKVKKKKLTGFYKLLTINIYNIRELKRTVAKGHVVVNRTSENPPMMMGQPLFKMELLKED